MQDSSPLYAATVRKRRTVGAYAAVIRRLPREDADAIAAYVSALTAEAAAQRVRAHRAEDALTRAGGAR